jgi:3-oxoacyl-[acyl-carrier protein] reductase
LVNNAGIYGPFGIIEDIDWPSWKRTFEINVYGTVYPSRQAVSLFKQQQYGKIVSLSGGGATNPLPRISAYAASKAAVVRFVETLALEVQSDHIDVNAIAPGALATQMTERLLEAGPEKVGQDFYNKMLRVKQGEGTPLECAARLAVYLGSAQSDGITGRLISAVWDPWEELHIHKERLSQTDIYTLRRIVPGDRDNKIGVK